MAGIWIGRVWYRERVEVVPKADETNHRVRELNGIGKSELHQSNIQTASPSRRVEPGLDRDIPPVEIEGSIRVGVKHVIVLVGQPVKVLVQRSIRGTKGVEQPSR